MSKTQSNYNKKQVRRKPKLQETARGSVLVDESEFERDGQPAYKQRQWQPRKIESQNIMQAYRAAGGDWQRYGDRMAYCASWLVFGVWEKEQQEAKRLRSAQFCKVRMCPMCQWRRSKKLGAQVGQVVSTYKERNRSHRALFLTLTMPNVEPEQGRQAVGELLAGFRKMTNSRRWKGFVQGAFRTVEVTRNEETGQIHPHLHVLLMVGVNYFTRERGQYLTQADWQHWWAECLGLPEGQEYIVDVRSVKRQHGKDGIGALAEVTKYCVKPEGIFSRYDEQGNRDKDFQIEPEVLTALHNTFHGRQLTMFYGEFRKIARELKLENIESDSADLGTADEAIREGRDHPEIGEYIGDMLFNWNRGQENYLLTEYRKKQKQQ